MTKYFKLFAFTLLIALTSCATIMHGTRQTVGVSSNPSNAAVWIDQYFVGYTPNVVELTRKDNHFVRIELDGYQPYEIALTRQLSGWVFGNVIFGGVVGLAVDAISGGIYKLTPDQVHADMYAHNMCFSCKKHHSPDTYVAIVLKPEASWERIGTLVSQR